jgi:hypothetical protein
MEKEHFLKPLNLLEGFFLGERDFGQNPKPAALPNRHYPYPLRNLNAIEIKQLEDQGNRCPDWSDFWVGPQFDPALIRSCTFLGRTRIAALTPSFISYSDLALPVGFYNSRIAYCDFGENVVVDNVAYLANYAIGDEVVLFNINELLCTHSPKFGNGALAPGEEATKRIWMEIRNENLGRKILPFEDMLPGDAWLWSSDRQDIALQNAYLDLTLRYFESADIPGTGFIGDRAVIKNTLSIKDVRIGERAYIKGANKLKNLTIRSGSEGLTQIGEGCELVNGIIGYGCRIFYGVKAVRFILADHSQLKYGARLINSYLGYNSVISCCEVLNALVCSNHEQHHNNSFLCSAALYGQSNMAAGATLGSNHNSRAADGELLAGRGFWPGLCVSLKYPSRFASYCLIAKGDYPHELDIRLPFSLVSNDNASNTLNIMPAYWFLHNQYALERNAWKYGQRDKRKEIRQFIEYDYLAPDTVQEILYSRELICQAVARALGLDPHQKDTLTKATGWLLSEVPQDMNVFLPEAERGNRPVCLIKPQAAYRAYTDLLIEYGVRELFYYLSELNGHLTPEAALQQLRTGFPELDRWENVGGQLIRKQRLEWLKSGLKSGAVASWSEVHAFYNAEGRQYRYLKCMHGLATLANIFEKGPDQWTLQDIHNWLEKWCTLLDRVETRLIASRTKDTENPFRRMMYEHDEEMHAVLGTMDTDLFIQAKTQAWAAERDNARRYLTVYSGLSDPLIPGWFDPRIPEV